MMADKKYVNRRTQYPTGVISSFSLSVNLVISCCSQNIILFLAVVGTIHSAGIHHQTLINTGIYVVGIENRRNNRRKKKPGQE